MSLTCRRDVTMNEVLILKDASGTALFFYTEDAKRDVAAQLIRPAVHCLKTEFHLAWALEDDGTPYTAQQQVLRSIVRFLKGHGKDYAFDEATWRHYRRVKLTKTELFKILKPFHDNDEKYQFALDHLISIGFLSRADIKKAGGANLLWGLLLEEINAQVSKHGARFVLSELDPEGVERWVDQKKATVAARLIAQEMRARRTGFAPSEESVTDLGLLSFPPELQQWLREGAVFNLQDHMARAAGALRGQIHQQLSSTLLLPPPSDSTLGSGPQPLGLRPAGGSNFSAVSWDAPSSDMERLRSKFKESKRPKQSTAAGIAHRSASPFSGAAAAAAAAAGGNPVPGSALSGHAAGIPTGRPPRHPPASSAPATAASAAAASSGSPSSPPGVFGSPVQKGLPRTVSSHALEKSAGAEVDTSLNGGQASNQHAQDSGSAARAAYHALKAAAESGGAAVYSLARGATIGSAQGSISLGPAVSVGSGSTTHGLPAGVLSGVGQVGRMPSSARSSSLAGALGGGGSYRRQWLSSSPQAGVTGSGGVTLARVESDDSEGSEGGAGEFPACSEAAPLTTGQGQQNQQQGNDQKSEEGPDGLGDEFEAELAALRAALTPANRAAARQALVEEDESLGVVAQQARMIEEVQAAAREANKRLNKDTKQALAATQGRRGLVARITGLFKADSGSASAGVQEDANPPPAGAEGSQATGSGQHGADASEPQRTEQQGALTSFDPFNPTGLSTGPGSSTVTGQGSTGGAWVKYSDFAEKLPAQTIALPGSFYQVSPAGQGGADDTEYVPLVTEKDAPARRRVPLSRLLGFLFAVMGLSKTLLMVAYALMLSGLAARLCLPRIEAAIFDAFNDLDASLFLSNLLLALGVVLADVALTLAGRLTLEQFARLTMTTTFRRFFEHVIFQDLPFFDRLSPGELMARTSGDSLTLRQLISVTTYSVIEGLVLFLGSLVFLTLTGGQLLTSKPGIAITFGSVILVNIAEGAFLGRLLRRLNLAVRQALGRMYGFTLDAFSKVDTVAALGLEYRVLTEYREYAANYFWHSYQMNTSLHFHRAFTTLMSALLRTSLLWFGGAALFADLTTVGTLFALLRYVKWMQKGLKAASDSYARLMAGLGSVERIVELHDRGVFGNGPSASEVVSNHKPPTRRLVMRGPSASPSPQRMSQAGDARTSSRNNLSQCDVQAGCISANEPAGATGRETDAAGAQAVASPFADAAVVAAKLQQVANASNRGGSQDPRVDEDGQHQQHTNARQQAPALQGLVPSGSAADNASASASGQTLTSYPPTSFTPLSGHTPIPGATPISSLTPVALTPTARSSVESSTTTMSSLTTATGMTGGSTSTLQTVPTTPHPTPNRTSTSSGTYTGGGTGASGWALTTTNSQGSALCPPPPSLTFSTPGPTPSGPSLTSSSLVSPPHGLKLTDSMFDQTSEADPTSGRPSTSTFPHDGAHQGRTTAEGSSNEAASARGRKGRPGAAGRGHGLEPRSAPSEPPPSVASRMMSSMRSMLFRTASSRLRPQQAAAAGGLRARPDDSLQVPLLEGGSDSDETEEYSNSPSRNSNTVSQGDARVTRYQPQDSHRKGGQNLLGPPLPGMPQQNGTGILGAGVESASEPLHRGWTWLLSGRRGSGQPPEARPLPPPGSVAGASAQDRPVFGQLMGGVRLADVHLTMRSRTNRLLLHDGNLVVMPGDICLLAGPESDSKAGLLALIMLRMIPYKGHISFQLPCSAIPSPAHLSVDVLPSSIPPPSSTISTSTPFSSTPSAGTPYEMLSVAHNSSTSTCSKTPVSSSGRVVTAAHVPFELRPAPTPDPAPGSTSWGSSAQAGGRVPAAGPASEAREQAGGGTAWQWVDFSFREDDMRAARSCVSLASLRVGGVFRTTLEDNVVVATQREVTSAEVRRICTQVGLHPTIMSLPDGYGTLVGDGSGTVLSSRDVLRLVLARALIRRPKILLLDDADTFSEAIGGTQLVKVGSLCRDGRNFSCAWELLEDVAAQGTAIIVATTRPHRFPCATKVYIIRNGKPWLVQ